MFKPGDIVIIHKPPHVYQARSSMADWKYFTYSGSWSLSTTRSIKTKDCYSYVCGGIGITDWRRYACWSKNFTFCKYFLEWL